MEMDILIPALEWTVAQGADAYPNDIAQWSDFDGDGLSDQKWR